MDEENNYKAWSDGGDSRATWKLWPPCHTQCLSGSFSPPEGITEREVMGRAKIEGKCEYFSRAGYLARLGLWHHVTIHHSHLMLDQSVCSLSYKLWADNKQCRVSVLLCSYSRGVDDRRSGWHSSFHIWKIRTRPHFYPHANCYILICWTPEPVVPILSTYLQIH